MSGAGAALTPEELVALARAMLDLDLPESCLPGVIEALAAIAGHARTIEHGA